MLMALWRKEGLRVDIHGLCAMMHYQFEFINDHVWAARERIEFGSSPMHMRARAEIQY